MGTSLLIYLFFLVGSLLIFFVIQWKVQYRIASKLQVFL